MNDVYREIFVVCDTNQIDTEHILQIVTKARELGNILKKNLLLFCIGLNEQKQLDHVKQYGVNTMLLYEKEQVSINDFCDILSAVLEERKPDVILFPSTQTGKSIAAVISARFEAGLVADCIDLEVTKEKKLYFSRAAINDSVIAKILCINTPFHMCTIKADVFLKKSSQLPVDCHVDIAQNVELLHHGDQGIQILEVIEREENQPIDINQYPIVFCIGRGIQNLNNRDRVFKLAECYGAGVVGTRAVVEEGFLEKERQIGQSGKNISPRIYVAFGVSGASQHMVGIKNADMIIAINEDKNASIFQYADYVIVDDLNVILSEMEKISGIHGRSHSLEMNGDEPLFKWETRESTLLKNARRND